MAKTSRSCSLLLVSLPSSVFGEPDTGFFGKMLQPTTERIGTGERMIVSHCSRRPVLVPCSLPDRDYQVDPYLGCSHYCYYCYVLNQAETDWTREIQMHDDIAGQLGAELESISPQTIYMGYYTDPYQPCEAEYQQTRKVLALLLDRGFSANILTKSNLVIRDMDLLQEMAHAHVSVSVAFTDDHIRQLFEANTVDTEVRIGALAELRKAGIHTGALICPVIPYITDVFTLLELLVPHTDVIWIYGLSIQERSDLNWRNVHNILDEHFPDLKERIESVIFAKDHPYWNDLRRQLEKIENDRQVDLRIRV